MSQHFRKNAGVVVFRADKKVLMCSRIDSRKPSWQFPQGGIESGESVKEAAIRELYEETSLRRVTWVAEIDRPIRYEFPQEIKEAFLKKGIVTDGQDQYWSLFYFDGDDAEIDLKTPEPEFDDYRWVDISEAPNLVWEVKKQAYMEMVKVFAPIIDNYS